MFLSLPENPLSENTTFTFEHLQTTRCADVLAPPSVEDFGRSDRWQQDGNTNIQEDESVVAMFFYMMKSR